MNDTSHNDTMPREVFVGLDHALVDVRCGFGSQEAVHVGSDHKGLFIWVRI